MYQLEHCDALFRIPASPIEADHEDYEYKEPVIMPLEDVRSRGFLGYTMYKHKLVFVIRWFMGML